MGRNRTTGGGRKVEASKEIGSKRATGRGRGGGQRLEEKLATREQLEELDRHRNGQKEKNWNKKKVRVRAR